MELSIPSRQCINRQFDSTEAMGKAIEAWQKSRHEKALGSACRFTTGDARVKLKVLYPQADK